MSVCRFGFEGSSILCWFTSFCIFFIVLVRLFGFVMTIVGPIGRVYSPYSAAWASALKIVCTPTVRKTWLTGCFSSKYAADIAVLVWFLCLNEPSVNTNCILSSFAILVGVFIRFEQFEFVGAVVSLYCGSKHPKSSVIFSVNFSHEAMWNLLYWMPLVRESSGSVKRWWVIGSVS